MLREYRKVDAMKRMRCNSEHRVSWIDVKTVSVQFKHIRSTAYAEFSTNSTNPITSLETHHLLPSGCQSICIRLEHSQIREHLFGGISEVDVHCWHCHDLGGPSDPSEPMKPTLQFMPKLPTSYFLWGRIYPKRNFLVKPWGWSGSEVSPDQGFLFKVLKQEKPKRPCTFAFRSGVS